MSRESYDQIATVYSTDMGQSMAFDDVGYYRELCVRRGGHTLELGCGTGRILLPLLESGIDIAGIDQSPGMLAQLQKEALALNLQPEVSIGTLADFTTPPCTTVLAPYCVVTYLTDENQLASFFRATREALVADGLLVVDTFNPALISGFNEFKLDYRRPHQDQVLQREKRITTLGSCNRIERRYTLLDATGVEVRTWTTVDVIRPWTAGELIGLAAKAGFSLAAKHGNFTNSSSKNDQFTVLHFNPVN